MPDRCSCNPANSALLEEPSNPSRTSIETTDHRAFVWSYAFLSESLSSRFGGPADRPEYYGHWVKLLNVDSPSGYFAGSWPSARQELATNDTSAFEREWARPRTYHRWARWSSYYGFSPHSGVLLSTALPSPSDIDLGRHFVTMYFDQALLLLYLRTAAFSFSARVAHLGAELRDDLTEATRYLRKRSHRRKRAEYKVIENHREAFADLRREFMSFASLYQFPLLSTQQQSVEMYTLARHYMDVDELFRDVASEIDAADRVIATHNEERVSRHVESLTFWGLPIAVTVLLMTLLGAMLKSKIAGTMLKDILQWKSSPILEPWSGLVNLGATLALLGVIWIIAKLTLRR